MAGSVKRIAKGEQLKLDVGFVEVGEDKYYLLESFTDSEERLRTFEVRNDDVYIAAFPKTGTTWVTEMVWMLINNFDTVGAKADIHIRVPLLEYSSLMKPEAMGVASLYDGDSMSYLDRQKDTRLIKTHLPWALLPEQIRNGTKVPKIITVLRNPKDVCVSYYHYLKMLEWYNGNCEDFCKLFLAGRVIPGPFWKYMQGYWDQKDRPNLLLICYKDMKKDLPAEIRRVANFLGRNVTQNQIDMLACHLSFDSMKKNPAVNYEFMRKKQGKKRNGTDFIRSGIEGDHITLMTPKIIEEFDAWTNGYIVENEALMRGLLAII